LAVVGIGSTVRQASANTAKIATCFPLLFLFSLFVEPIPTTEKNGLLVHAKSEFLAFLCSDLKGHGNEADFLGVLNKSVPH
jgi:hypothetical protein